ncbi:MAG TPA: arginine/agmatine antiporter [Dongiaceae bacterium]|nr:arginine/agmatine antiporter [Dongiaceae bacterium]
MSDGVKKVGVVAATLMVAGNIMGSGVFMLPANLAATGGIAIFGWVVTIIGAIALSLVYAKFASFEEGSGGSYAYVKKAFGDYLGYQTNFVYWLAGWVGNIAMAVVGVGYLAYFFPFLKDPFMSAVGSIAMIWLFTFLNILGPTVVTKVQSYTTSLVFIPIFGVAIFGWFWFDGATYLAAWNVTGKSAVGAIQGTLNVTLWAFIGVETAAVVAGVVENPKKNVPIATMGGVLIAATAYVLSSSAIMGIIPNAQLVQSAAPFADAVQVAIGPTAGAIVSFCAAVGCLGSLGGWTLVVGQTAKAAADDGLFPPLFAKVNAAGTPYLGLVLVAAMMTGIVLFTISPTAAAQFGVISSISVIMTLLPYIYTCAALRELGPPHFRNKQWLWRGVILVAIAYSTWAVVGSDATQVLWSFVIVLLTTLLFARNQLRVARAAAE